MNNYLLKFLPLTSILFLSQLSADTITLTDGSTLDGKIIEEKGDEIIIEVRVTENIKDLKTYKKSEIKKVVEKLDDEKPFAEISAMVPTADRLSVQDYQNGISKTTEFIEKFPTSKHIAEVKKIQSTLQEEAKKVEEGSLKLVGNWVSPEQQKANAYDIDAMVNFTEMKSYIAANNPRQAALSYEKLINNTPNSSYQKEADQLALKLYHGYQAIIQQQMKQAPILAEEREKAIASVDTSVATSMKAEIERTNDLYLAAYEKAKDDRVKWIPTSPYHPKQLEELSRHLDKETKTLEKKLSETSSTETPNLGIAYKNAWDAIEAKDLKKATEAFSTLKSARQKPAQSYVQTIQTRIDDLSTELKAKEEADKKAAAEAAEEAKAAEKEAAEKAKAPQSASKKPAQTPATSSEATQPDGATQASNAEATLDQDFDDSEGSEDSGFGLMNVLYGVIALALIAILVMFFSGSKKKKN